MAIRRSRKLRKSRKYRRQESLRAQRRTERGLRIEPLEDRRLLAVGPQLVGIQPNVGELLTHGQVRNTAPVDLSLLFNSVADISVPSLPTIETNPQAYDSIQITRSGFDGTFEHASVFSDFNTDGAVQIQFDATRPGQGASLTTISVAKADLENATFPLVDVVDRNIQITLNSSLGSETTARQLVDAVNADPDASALVSARIRSGFSGTDIATPDITYSPLTMAPANSASAVSNFNSGAGLAIQLTATAPGVLGNGIVMKVSRADLDIDTPPTITTTDRTIEVVLNANTTTPTTAQQLVDALNTDPGASLLLVASLPSGLPDTPLGSSLINYSPIVLTGANDMRIEPGYLDLGDSAREVVVRFKDHLPDDVYMIEVLGGGPTPLTNVDDEPFEDGKDFQTTFELDLGAQVTAVVPQPISSDAQGRLTQRRNQIEVYFNNDDLDPTTAQDPRFYQLIYTGDTVDNADDLVQHPTSVVYDAGTDMATLTFSGPIEDLVSDGTYRLRIGTDEVRPATPINVPVVVDPGSSFDTAMDVTPADINTQALLFTTEIRQGLFPLDYPGGNDEPGHRDIPWVESHLNAGGDQTAGISTFYYNFKDEYGFDPITGNVLHNAITANEQQRAREVFDFYSNYLGVNFIESANRGFTIVTGDLRVVDPNVPTGPGGVIGIAGTTIAVMDLQDFSNPGDDRFGGPWFQTAMHEIGHLLGLGHTYDLPNLTVQGAEPSLDFDNIPEAVFPGDHDIAHGQHLFRPESNDIDIYRFDLTDRGLFSAETSAERLADPSQLDTVLTLYRAVTDIDGNITGHELVSRNDDYFSSDSHVEMVLEPGTYYVGVSASGNLDYDPEVEDTGAGGRSQGNYQLRLNFRPDADNTIVDATGVAFDGDADGNAGGVYNYWFRAATPSGLAAPGTPQTIYVNKAAADGGNGSMGAPYNAIPAALATSRSGDVVRLVGNPGADGDITTLGDNLAYQIGFSRVGGAILEDGATLEVPQGVTVMIDANAVLKLRRARIGVGSSAQGIDRSAGALQVLGTPRIIDPATGQIRLDDTGQPIVGSVYFTSLHDKVVGKDSNPDQRPPDAVSGDWGGIVFRSDLDRADADRLVYDQRGVFVNYVNHANMTYGGGDVFINGASVVVAPIHLIDERPTLTFNTITLSADAAISANPDSFEEDNFHSPKFQAVSFTSDYTRVGPEIHHNLVVENSLNGLFIRVSTAAGQETEPLTKSARWDDTDITHIVAENLIVRGQAGGPILEEVAPPVELVVLQAFPGGTLAANDYIYKLVNVDADGNEGPPSNATRSVTVTAVDGSVRLTNLPTLKSNDPFVARRIYRSIVGTGRFELVAEINRTDVTFLDIGSSLGSLLVEFPDSVRARLSARQAVDAGTIVKLDRARIDATFGGQLIAEGRDGRPILFTSLRDDRYGASGTFDTSLQVGQNAPQPGDWAGLYLGHLSSGSLEYVVVAYGGGTTKVEGTFTGFNPVEIHQSETRIANSKFEFNANGMGGQAPGHRFGRGTHNPATIFVRGAQPIIINNTLIQNGGTAISVNANSLNSIPLNDVGRTTGPIDIFAGVNDNQGPLVRLNQLDLNDVNGMTVRGGTMTTQGVWDDTDIVHVLRDNLYVPDFHTSGGLRLESNPQQSLVVKLEDSGVTATGRELDITDRIGGSLQIVGQPRFPVVMTSINDCSVGAGFTPGSEPQTDTLNSGLCRPGQAVPYADVIVVMDESASMSFAQTFSVGLVADLDQALINDGIGDGQLGINRFGLVGFGGFTPEELGHAHPVGSNGELFGTSTEYATAALTLVDDGSTEDGYEAFDFMLKNYMYRPDAERFVLLVTNEDRDILDASLNFQNTLAALNTANARLQGIVEATIQDGQGVNALALDANGNAYLADGAGGFTISPGGSVIFASGNTEADYIDMVHATGGLAGDINQIQQGGNVATSFANALVTSIVGQVGQNPAGPGDWTSLRLDPLSNDRNVDVATEREPRDLTSGPDNNQTPDSAQFLGHLAPHEKAGDDTLRLGFEVQGVVAQPDDVDVYSFRADAGTEVWFDVDRTTQSLDTVVELVDAAGNIITQSDDSYSEQLGQTTIFVDPTRISPVSVNALRKSAEDFYPSSAIGEPKDLWSINQRDAGLRIVLPGSPGTNNLYYVRVRSSNLKPGDPRSQLQEPARLGDGLTSGIYQMQIRLREVDEVPGSTVQFADIRFATDGIEVIGQPTHSQLTGEAGEDATTNDTLGTAQPLGNVLNADRGTLGVAGDLSQFDDVDFYQFDIAFDSIQNIQGFTNSVQHLASVLDIDYADGLARPNTRISVFDSAGNLVLHAGDSNIADDLPAAGKGINTDDLSRGSAGTLDPYIGTQELLAGTYYVAISSDAQVPAEFDQFYSPVPANPLFRLEPVDSVARIAEDHIGTDLRSTAQPPQIPVLFDDSNAVNYDLSDVILFVSTETGGTSNARLFTVDPFTGAQETEVSDPANGRLIGRDIEDIGMRPDGSLFAFALDVEDFDPRDNESGNYIQIDTGDATTTLINDNGIETWRADANGGDQRHDVGYQFLAMAYTQNQNLNNVDLFAVGNRTIPGAGNAYTENVLYQFNPITGLATSRPTRDRGGCGNPGGCRYVGAGTQIVERGELVTDADPFGLADTMLIVDEATDVNRFNGATNFLITDGLTFAVDHDNSPITPPVVFEFNAGPEIRVHPDPAGGAFARDEDFFEIDGDIYEFDTGSVLGVSASSGSQIGDGDTFTITDNQVTPVTRTFEFDKNGNVAAGNVRVSINNGMSTQLIMTRMTDAINAVIGFDVVAESVPNSNRISLRNESATIGATASSSGVFVSGTPGGTASADFVIPIEETSDLNEYGNAIVQTFSLVAGVTAGWDGERINFMGAGLGDFSRLQSRGVFTDTGSNGSALFGLSIPFLAQDSGPEIAARVVAELTVAPFPGTPAISSDRTVILTGGATFTAADAPLRITGAAPGGFITGIALVGSTMYGVSDAGGLYRINNYGSPLGASATYLPTSAQDLQGIRFEALTNGPVATEGGLYSDLLFGMDTNGTLYAFDTAGRLQPVFVDGRTSVETGLGAVHGMAFSILEENPWGTVNGQRARSRDAGHGLDPTFDLTRYDPVYPIDGNASLHFGRTRDQNLVPITYDWPGGAHGTMISNPFNLTGYSASDKPALYFTYFADTEEESSDPATQSAMFDSLRVYIGDDSGQWDILQTNDSYVLGDLFLGPNTVQETFDNGNGWRQVRVELDNYAGLDNLRLRVDFATAGTQAIGTPDYAGSDLHVLPASELSDGQTFTIDGVDFEIDLGYTMIAPSGAVINDGDTFRIRAGFLDRTFEFDRTGILTDPSHIGVPFNLAMTPNEVAQSMETAILSQTFVPNFAEIVGNRVNLPRTDLVEVDPAGAVMLVGDNNTAGVPISLHANMLAGQVTSVVQQAMADTFSRGVTESFKTHDAVVRVIGHTVSDPGPFGLTDSLPGDLFGDFFNRRRGQNNRFEGIYLDDFVIGFAERGEMGTNGAGNSAFIDNPDLPASQILVGPYQLEVRQAEKNGDSFEDSDRLELFRSIDTNDRLNESFSLIASPANEISDGQTFTLSDGVNSLVYEFDDVDINDGVVPGHVEINFDPTVLDPLTGDYRPQTESEVAASIREAINSAESQAVIDITGGLADGANSPFTATTNSVINLYGNVNSDVIQPNLTITGTTMDGNQLRDAILGGAFEPVGDAIYEGGPVSSGFFNGGGTSIGIDAGVVLSTGDVQFTEGPNVDDGSTGFASGAGDADLDAFFDPFVTEDSSSLEFSFRVDQPGDLFFEFVFSSEEYNEFVDSIFNDVFGFFVDGENIGFVPGTFDPVSINTVNGGNPFGTGGPNAQFYNNNDRDDDGSYLEAFGHDGFTDVFVARKDALAAGVHTIKLAISDVGDTVLDSAVFIRAFNSTGPDPRTQIRGEIFNDGGDTNLFRDQGQVVIHSNTITKSLGYGIVVDAADRSAEGKPHSGPVRNTRVVNDINLVPGVVLTNNVISRNSSGGISFRGDPNAGTDVAAPAPFGRVINNTIFGGNVGIEVQDNASPTLLNNILSDNTTGISIDATSASTVIGGTVFAGNTTPSTGGLGEFPIVLPTSEGLFVNKSLDNFYLAENAAPIDSSIDSLDDRAAMVTVRDPLGISDSPILAPNFDIYGQQRIDDPAVNSPSGLGQNVFKDRGAIDRADFSGPSATITNPRDNDAAGIDQDSRATFVELVKQTLFNFQIQLIDGVPPSNQSNGTGPDASTVLPETVLVTKDNVPLEEGVDYRFSYDTTAGIIRLTPLAGIWAPDHAYEVELLNADVIAITADDGSLLSDGDTFDVTDGQGTTATFEFETGYMINAPAGGGADLIDGSSFTITRGTTNPVTTTFEFDDNGVSRPTSVVIPYTSSDSVDAIADAVALAIRTAGIGLAPQSLTGGGVHVGGTTDTVVDVSSSALTQTGLPGVTLGNVAVPLVPHVSFDAGQVANAIALAVNGSSLSGVEAEARLDNVFITGAVDVQGLTSEPINAIRDLAGNILQPNRFNGSTTFTIFLGSGLDYGDAPDPSYPVLQNSNGARHEVQEGFMLGDTIFSTVDGEPSAGADSDIGDDGVTFSPMTAAYESSVGVVVNGINANREGRLDAWIDFNADGDWKDPGEHILDSVVLVDGANTLPFNVPGTAAATSTFARFRLSSAGGLAPNGPAADGEVEDYLVSINPNPWQNGSNALDVNGDTEVTPLDALLVINLINFNPDVVRDPLPIPPTGGFTPPPFYDVNGDGFVTPLDALIVINDLNQPSGSGEGEGEGEGGGWLASSGGSELVPLLDNGLSNTLSGSSLLAGPSGGDQRDAPRARRVSGDDRQVEQPIYVGGPEPGNASTSFAAEDFGNAGFDSLLDDIADDVGDAMAGTEGIDSFFARYRS